MAIKRIRKPTADLSSELQRLREYRGEIDVFVGRLLLNFCRHVPFMHNLLKKNAEGDDVELGYHYYLPAIISVLETFFRDLFIFTHTVDEEVFERLLQRIGGKRPTDAEAMEAYNVNLCELASRSFNFQNLSDIDNAFSEAFPNGLIKDSCETHFEFVQLGPAHIENFAIYQLFGNWKDLLSRAYSERHNIVHDANYRASIPDNFGEVEFLLLVLPQVAALLVSQRYSVKYIRSQRGAAEAIPFLFSTRELVESTFRVPEGLKDENASYISMY